MMVVRSKVMEQDAGRAAAPARALRVLMLSSEWPSPERPDSVPFVVRQFEFVRRAGVHVDLFHFQGHRNPLNYVRAWLRLRQVMRKQSYDLIHAQFGQSGLLPWPRRAPLVVTFRGCDLLGVKGPDGTTTRAGRMLQELCRLVARHADAVIVVSDPMRALLPPSVPAHVLPSGLDLSSLPCIPRETARRRLGLPLDERLVLFVGNPASTRKRCDLARRAVGILSERLPARLVIAWRVPHEEVPLYMSACDALLFTSRQEGSPNVVKEALACNLPVVSVAVGDVPERIGGVEGCELCADDRPETIAAALERVLRRGERIRGRETVRELDEARLTLKLLSIYRSVLPPGVREEIGEEIELEAVQAEGVEPCAA